MDSLHTVNGKPISATEEKNVAGLRKLGIDAQATGHGPKVTLTHKPECGDVGETGEHGDIGSNAAE